MMGVSIDAGDGYRMVGNSGEHGVQESAAFACAYSGWSQHGAHDSIKVIASSYPRAITVIKV